MFLMLHNSILNKENFDSIFQKLADLYVSKVPTEKVDVFIVGGCAILLQFNYRLSTMDIDAIFNENDFFIQCVEEISKEMNLPPDWLNQDFVDTPSYSPKIVEVASLYKTFNNFINVYITNTEYLIAMKLKSSRPTGGDLDDIVKMVYELRYNGSTITYRDVINAYEFLYSDYSNTYSYFLEKTKEAFEKPLEEIAELIDCKRL